MSYKASRQEGTIKRIPNGQSFGFIRGVGEKFDRFFHKDESSSHIKQAWGDDLIGSEVSFIPDKNAKGPRARDVELS